MWSEILKIFSDSPSQSKVIRFLLENGLGVNTEGRVTVNKIQIPSTKLAHEIGVDRRVVDSTASRILEIPFLSEIFLNIRATPDLSDVADNLGLTVITLIPKDAKQKGIIGSTVRLLDHHGIRIRQLFVTDPHLSEEPKLVIITEDKLPAGVIEEIKALPQVKYLIL